MSKSSRLKTLRRYEIKGILSRIEARELARLRLAAVLWAYIWPLGMMGAGLALLALLAANT